MKKTDVQTQLVLPRNRRSSVACRGSSDEQSSGLAVLCVGHFTVYGEVKSLSEMAGANAGQKTSSRQSYWETNERQESSIPLK